MHCKHAVTLLFVSFLDLRAIAVLLGGVLGMFLYHRKQKKIYLVAKQDSEAGSGMPGERMTGKR
jgi:hypothetical protein